MTSVAVYGGSARRLLCLWLPSMTSPTATIRIDGAVAHLDPPPITQRTNRLTWSGSSRSKGPGLLAHGKNMLKSGSMPNHPDPDDSGDTKQKDVAQLIRKQNSASFVIQANDMWQVICHSVATARRPRHQLLRHQSEVTHSPNATCPRDCTYRKRRT